MGIFSPVPYSLLLLLFLCFDGYIAALPTAAKVDLEPRAGIIGGLLSSLTASPTPITDSAQLKSILAIIDQGIASDVAEASLVASAYEAILTDIVPSPTPASIPSALSAIASIASLTPSNVVDYALELFLNGLTPNDAQDILAGFTTGQNSDTNVNPRNPSPSIYPKKSSSDAPYDLTEAQLRGAIHIPSTFTYGQTPPVILVPGTGAPGGVTFAANYIKLLTGTTYADPVWLNIPGFTLDDAQVNAEYVAYAINYISGITNNQNISLISWSQGSLDIQWALKYWPSTRSVVSDFIPISPDLHGTVIAYFICPGFPKLPCDASVLQQEYSSNFITTLRSNGGDSAYVPTTAIYSSLYDQIVEPQAGTSASGFFNDARNIGVTNNEVQKICPGQPAGSFYTHEGMLFNPIAFELAVDALRSEGPGEMGRLDLGSVCQMYAATGLSLADVLATSADIVVAAFDVVKHVPKVLVEPAVKGYAA